ncbi:MAG: hypothetical protein J0I42_13400 [Bosea sp.]|uniref:hypothetical protein n=1 Tax=Bosea sp. (in: a-proteobacteria) TaxID=1871050 RepID=UPI001ACC832B|nr:hypothetical protein [Bosea sp. (in: a-proteobacteria)]MBN9452938.1 hypothetical protein [Bosea sp. (in: a-proteobacteria)]
MAHAMGINPYRMLTRFFRMEPTRLDIISAPMPTDEALCADIIIIPQGRFLAASHMKAGPYAIDPSKPVPLPIPPVTYTQEEAAQNLGRTVPPSEPPAPIVESVTPPAPTVATEPKAEDRADIERLFHAIRIRHGYR